MKHLVILTLLLGILVSVTGCSQSQTPPPGAKGAPDPALKKGADR